MDAHTHCTKQCPLITANLARVQRQIGDRLGKDIFFYSVSLDPVRDTPEVLKAYAQAFRAKPGWTFLTGKKEDIEKVRKKFGDFEEIESHSANLVIGNDATGQWFATGAIDNPGYLGHVISDWLDPSWDKRPLKNSYANVPKVKRDQGADVFRQKCAMCHTGENETVGASLEGITSRRDPEWLLRWLHAPERMLADKDPIAVALVAKSNGRLLMPNQGLSEEEARAVIAYMGRPPVKTTATAP